MKIEVLVATMYQKDFSLVKKMRLRTDAFFANQTDKNEYEEIVDISSEYRMISTTTRGVGKNRNLALIFAKGDILLFADEDVVYKDGYEDIITGAFKKYVDADAIIFGTEYTLKGETYLTRTPPEGKLPIWKSFRYGTICLAVKRKSVLSRNLSFSELFGGGCIYSHGEDSVFIIDCYKSKMKVYASANVIQSTAKDVSTCFTGYNQKYFYDAGALAKACMGIFAIPYIMYLSVRINKDTNLKFIERVKCMLNGYKSYENLKQFSNLK